MFSGHEVNILASHQCDPSSIQQVELLVEKSGWWIFVQFSGLYTMCDYANVSIFAITLNL